MQIVLGESNAEEVPYNFPADQAGGEIWFHGQATATLSRLDGKQTMSLQKLASLQGSELKKLGPDTH